MKKLIILLLIFCAVGAQAQIAKVIPPKPNPPRLVNDLAGVLTQEQVQTLEQKLVNYDDSTSNQVVIVTLKTTGDYDIQEVALGILRNWQVGNKDKNNGVVLLAAIDDHKVFIATGYGLEGALPDVTVKSIIDNDIVPGFREGNYYNGFDIGTTSIFKAAAGEYRAPAGYAQRGGGKPGQGIGFSKIIIGIVILFVVLGMFGSGGGGGGGGLMSRRGSGWLGPMILGSLLGGGGRGFGGGGFGGGGGGGGFGGVWRWKWWRRGRRR
ncbi:MAG: hypothetical protein NVS1B13_24790 [Flavisolibacter sp.]